MKLTRILLSLLLIILTLALRQGVAAFGDDFNDGDSAGWTEVAPLVGVGGSATFSHPDGNSYRMQSAPSPSEDVLGPARVGSLREDIVYDDFYQFVDVIDYDQSLDQNIGLLARVTDVGLGTLDGYAATYNPVDQQMFFTVITDEAGNNLDDVEVPVNVGDPVRMVLRGSGSSFVFEIFAFPDLDTPVASIELSDATYASGSSGVFAVTDFSDPALAVDCTFDNYFSEVEEPTGEGIVQVELPIDGDTISFEFPSLPTRLYSIWESNDLMNWIEITDTLNGALAFTTLHSLTIPDVPKKYYHFRLAQ